MIVAFGHRTGVGKDTAAKMLVSMMRLSGKYPRGVRKSSFAKPLKDCAHLMFSCYGLREGEFYDEPENWKLKDVPLPVVNKTPRQIWIELGTKGREIYPGVWRDACLGQEKDCDVLVISDLRFTNEGEGVNERGGICVLVESSKMGAWHKMDHELKGWGGFQAALINDGTLKDFEAQVFNFATMKGLL